MTGSVVVATSGTGKTVGSPIFAGTAEHYAKHRPRYPQELLSDLVRRSAGAHGRSLVDLGSGTGEVALPLSSSFDQVTAIDIDPTMVAVAQDKARAEGVGNVTWIVGPAESLEVADCSAELVVAGSSFHWMDRELLSARAHRWLVDGGMIAVLGGGSDVWENKAGWHAVAIATIQRWLGERRRAGSGTYTVTKQHGDFLEPAGFTLESKQYRVQHVWNADSIVGYLFSTSFASPALLGSNTSAFEADLRGALNALSPDDAFPEVLDFYAILGHKNTGS